MKSPTSSVGTIELDGILNGSTRNERSRNTIRITGKKLTEYSTHHGCLASAGRERRSHAASSAHTTPVTTSRISRNRDRKSTRLNSSHGYISYAVFCLKKKKKRKKKKNQKKATQKRA